MSTVVVGMDGSDNAEAALRWAARFAASTRPGVLHLVAADGAPSPSRDRIEALVAAAIGTSDAPELHIHSVAGEVAAALTGLAEQVGAAIIALGAHSSVMARPRAVGGVTSKTLWRAGCPVAVVKSNWAPPRTDGGKDSGAPIVVGVGDGRATDAALQWATELAAQLSAPMRLVRAVDLHPVFGLRNAVDVMASYLEPEQLVRWASEELDRLAADAEVSVERVVAPGRVGEVLADHAADGAMVVIGKHFDGRLTGYLMGRGLHHALLHVPCPVVVVPQSAG